MNLYITMVPVVTYTYKNFVYEINYGSMIQTPLGATFGTCGLKYYDVTFSRDLRSCYGQLAKFMQDVNNVLQKILYIPPHCIIWTKILLCTQTISISEKNLIGQ